MADGPRSSTNSGNKGGDDRMKKLEDLLQHAINRINGLQDKVDELEKEALSRRTQIRRLEEKITGRQIIYFQHDILY
jgi:peptidoglycan hydrolase CwlO-like protein